jgi:hypothetical protein
MKSTVLLALSSSVVNQYQPTTFDLNMHGLDLEM